MRVAAVADLHCGVNGTHEMNRLLEGVGDAADVLALGGDLTNLGELDEGKALAEALVQVPIPVVAVLGNHDHESGLAPRLAALLTGVGVHVLDGTTWEYDGVGFAGVKGFGVGFAPHRLAPFGEAAIKEFVNVSVREAAALDHALASLESAHRVALLHYSPIPSTLEGEPSYIFPFLGDSLLGEVLDRRGAEVAIHGHAHGGRLEGFTEGGVRVLNVSRHVLCRVPGGREWTTFDVPAHA
ncbi:MAG: metallophosphoesterase [Actinobacteria bacterium]|nr:metallophosphoesterase [Actinomycetota bacterium]